MLKILNRLLFVCQNAIIPAFWISHRWVLWGCLIIFLEQKGNVKHTQEAGEVWSWGAAAPCLRWSAYFWRKGLEGIGEIVAGQVLAGTWTAPLQTLSSPEDLAQPSQVGDPFVPAHRGVDMWALSMALGRCCVFWTRWRPSLEPLLPFKSPVALPMRTGGKANPWTGL